MSIFDKNWVPSDKQKAWAEKFIWPLVVGMRILTSWYVSILWAFLIPYMFGQGLIFCVFFVVNSRL